MVGLKVAPAALDQTELRIQQMDAQGIDVEALSINPVWYKPERDVAEKMIRTQNEKLAELCAKHPDRFVAFATTAMQHPDLAVQQLEYGVKKLGLRGMSCGTHVDGEELSDPKFHPIWAKCEELGMPGVHAPEWHMAHSSRASAATAGWSTSSAIRSTPPSHSPT